MRLQSTRHMLSAAFLLAATLRVWGDTLSPASGVVEVCTLTCTPASSGPLAEGVTSTPDGLGDSASANAVGSPFPLASVEGISELEAIAQSSLDYQFEVAGPSNVSVPLLVSGDLWASVSNPLGQSNAQAFLTIVSITAIQVVDESVLADCVITCPGGLVNSSDGFTDAITVSSGLPYDVSLTADLSIEGNSLGSANADPYIQIDPSFASANPGFSLEFSDGIDNAPITTPEPRSLPLLGSVLTALSMLYVRRSRRRKQG